MSRFAHLILFLSLISSHSFAQNVQKITIQQAVDIALKNVIELKNLQLDADIQYLKNKEVIGAVYPQISASGQGTYYTNLPKIQFPSSNLSVYQVLAKEGVKDATGNPIDVNKASYGVQPVSFVAPLNFQFGLSVQQLIFQPDVFIAFQARQTVLDFANQNVTVSKQKTIESVQKAYYSVLIAEKQKSVLSETKQRLEKLFGEMTEMYKNGFVERLDLDKLQVTLNNTQTAQNQLDNAIKISTSLLKNAMGIPQQDSVVLIDQLNVQNIQTEIMSSQTGFDYQDRSEYTLLTIAKKLQELDIRRNKLGYLPTVAAFYNLQETGQRNQIYAVNGRSPWFWFSTGLIGLTINQPIFDGLQRKQKIAQSKLALQKVDNNLEQMKNYIDLDKNIALNTVNNAILNLQIQERNMALAESVFNTTKKKYQSGIGSSFELLQTDTELQRANGGYFQALYDAYIAKIAYMKSIGKL